MDCSKFFTNINLFNPDNDFLRKNWFSEKRQTPKYSMGSPPQLSCTKLLWEITPAEDALS